MTVAEHVDQLKLITELKVELDGMVAGDFFKGDLRTALHMENPEHALRAVFAITDNIVLTDANFHTLYDWGQRIMEALDGPSS